MSKRIIITLNDLQEKALEELMATDLEENRSAYVSRLISQEYLRRNEAVNKRPVGRPKKSEEPVDTNKYPAPYKGGLPYSREDWEMYWEFRPKQETPVLPKPLTPEEIAKFDD